MTERVDSVVGRALAACVAGRRYDAVERVLSLGLLPQLIESARSHRVLNLVHLVLDGRDTVDEAIGAGLKRYYLHQIGHHLRALEDLAALDDAFAQRDIPWLLVKGPVLSEVIYERSDLRVYHDLDVVVAREAFPGAIGALHSAGAQLLDRNWDLILREGRTQLHAELRLGTVADVHHHLLNRAVVRHSLSLPMEDMLARARTVSLGRVSVRTLDPVDTLLHLCVHAALAGGNRLVWLKDVERSVVREAPPWTELVDRATASGAGPLTAVILSRARDVLGCPVPDGVTRRLFGSRSKAWVTVVVDGRWPVTRSDSRPTLAVIWAQVLRDTWGRTLAALVSRLGRPLLKRTGRRDAEEDWAHPAGHASRSPGAQDVGMAEYLREVAERKRVGDAD